MKAIVLTSICACLLLPTATMAQGKQVAKGKVARIMKNKDGSLTEFRKQGDDRVLVRSTLTEARNGSRVLQSRTVYRKDKQLNLRSGKIYDGKGIELFRVIYGYHKDTGQLVAENMYDSRVKRADVNGKEIPVRTVRYTYDAHGNRSRPIIFTALPGKTAEELFRPIRREIDESGSTYPHNNPFK